MQKACNTLRVSVPSGVQKLVGALPGRSDPIGVDARVFATLVCVKEAKREEDEEEKEHEEKDQEKEQGNWKETEVSKRTKNETETYENHRER